MSSRSFDPPTTPGAPVAQKRLYWIHRNRTRRDRVRPADALLRALVDEASGNTAVRLARIRETLEAVVDRTFLAHCRMAGIRDGTLVVGVDPPGLVHAMRLQWESTVRTVTRRASGGAVCRVTFIHAEPEPARRRSAPG